MCALTGLRHAGDPRSLAILEQVAADREARTDVRAHAIEQLGLATPSPRAEPLLAELLSDDDYQVRTAANAALGRILGGDRTRIALHALGSPYEAISAPAARYLATAGEPATLVGRLGGIASADIRRMLREGLVRRGALPVPELDAALRGEDVRPRTEEAAWIAGAAGDAARPLAPAIASAIGRGATQLGSVACSPARPAPSAPTDRGRGVAWRPCGPASARVGIGAGAEARWKPPPTRCSPRSRGGAAAPCGAATYAHRRGQEAPALARSSRWSATGMSIA